MSSLNIISVSFYNVFKRKISSKMLHLYRRPVVYEVISVGIVTTYKYGAKTPKPVPFTFEGGERKGSRIASKSLQGKDEILPPALCCFGGSRLCHNDWPGLGPGRMPQLLWSKNSLQTYQVCVHSNIYFQFRVL